MIADAYTRSRNNKLPKAPTWMRSNGLTADDWAVITQYISVLEPLKEATKRLEARGKVGRSARYTKLYPSSKPYLPCTSSYSKTTRASTMMPTARPKITFLSTYVQLGQSSTRITLSSTIHPCTSLLPASTHTTRTTVRTAGSTNRAGSKQTTLCYNNFGRSISRRCSAQAAHEYGSQAVSTTSSTRLSIRSLTALLR
jgi:hypothetical protein